MAVLLPRAEGCTVRNINYWSVAITKRKEEERAASHVERQGFEYWLPRMVEWTTRGAERRVLLFPGYILVKICRGWEVLSSTKGVSSVIMGANEQPARIADSEFAYLRSLENSQGLVVFPPKLRDGDSVVFVEGSRRGVRAIVDGDSSAGFCKVLWSLLGKEVSEVVREGSLELA